MRAPVIYLVRSWPRLSQTFIVNEVLALERRGVDISLFSMVRSGEELVQPQVDDVRARVHYLDDPRSPVRALIDHLSVLRSSPLGYLLAVAYAVRHPELSTGYANCSTLACFGSAVRLAAAIGRLRSAGHGPAHLHAHFAHDPALVALIVRRLTGVPYSVTAHARDLVQIPAASLAARSAGATTLVTCCQANADYIAATMSGTPADHQPDTQPDTQPDHQPDHQPGHQAGGRRTAPVQVIHHGVDLDHFRPPTSDDIGEPGGTSGTATVVTVGRLVEKKGFGDLLQSLAKLKADGHAFGCELYGDGPLRDDLVATRDALGLTDEVRFRGEQDREQIIAALRAAEVFVLTPVVTDDGDRDGIPNVLVEAMACGLPVVTTSSGGIPELVEDGTNGYLTAPADIAAVTDRLGRLLQDAGLRRDMGAAARRTVESDYDVNAAARRLEVIFRTGRPAEREEVP
jgi:glycosyltransferase involved in cell wall biosynthesis